jgi:hypothetical protein
LPTATDVVSSSVPMPEDRVPHGCGDTCHQVCENTFKEKDGANSCKLVWKANNCNAHATTDPNGHDTCRVTDEATIHGSVRRRFLERRGHATVSRAGEDDEPTTYKPPAKCGKECHEVCLNTFPQSRDMQQRCMDKWVTHGCELHSGYGRRFRGKCRLTKVVQLHPDTKKSMALDH